VKKILTLLLFGLLLSSYSFAYTSYRKAVKCPIDAETFTITVTTTYTTFGTMADFQKYGAIGELYQNTISSCPKCRYAGSDEDFDTTFTGTTKEDILKILAPYKNLKMNDVIECEIAGQIHTYLKSKNDAIANIYLVGSYLLKTDTTQNIKRKELQRLCISFLNKAIENKEYPEKETYASVNYLVGELSRRIGDFDNAIKYFDLALNDENKKDWLTDMAKTQKNLALKKDESNYEFQPNYH
jgi:uncharacterized protein (DUF2225 family)